MQHKANTYEGGVSGEGFRHGLSFVTKSTKRLIIAIAVLVVCLGFTLYYAFFSPHPGFSYDIYWNVRDVLVCSETVITCGTSDDSIQIGDKIVAIGSLTFSDWFEDRSHNPFDGFRTGDSIPIKVDREGSEIEISWVMPPTLSRTRVEASVFPLLIYLPFWVVGSIGLLLIHPQGTTWRLFIALNYITAVWLAIGLSPTAPHPLAAALVHAISWLMAAVFLHFHLLVPEPVRTNIPRAFFAALYGLAGLFLILELLRIVPVDFYILAVIVAFIGSLVLVVYQAARATSVANKVISRVMLAGVALALIPGLILWLVPRTFDFDSSSLISVIVPIIAIAALPLFYLYAIYKKELGRWEFRLNRLLYYYTLFLLTFTVLALVFLIGTRWQPQSNDVSAIFILAAASVLVLFIPLQRRFQHFLDRLAYSSSLAPEDLYKKFATRIPAAANSTELKSLLESEILPNLGVHQSAIFLFHRGEVTPLHLFNTPEQNTHPGFSELQPLLSVSSRYIGPDSSLENPSIKLSWVRLVIPIKSRQGSTGIWLFGARYPDDFYSRNDIGLMESLADQLAITIENQRLVEEIKRELKERQQAEMQKQRFADRIKLIHEIDQAILAADSKHEIAEAVIRRVPQLVPCEQVSILTFEEEVGEAELLGSLNQLESEASPESGFQVADHTQANQKLNLKRSDEAAVDSSRVDAALALIPSRKQDKSTLLVPLMASDHLIGILYIGSSTSGAFEADHEEIASEIANSLALAIQNQNLISAVEEHSRKLQRLSNQLMSAQESERTRISQELHDEIGQLITAIFFNVAAVDALLEETTLPEVRERLEDTGGLIEQLLEGVRSLSLDLRPPMLQDLGLIPTLRWYLKSSAKRLDILIVHSFKGLDRRFPDAVETAVYRIVQEALTNAIRHGQADRIRVILACTDSDINLEFEDNGIGFNPEKIMANSGSPNGAGLLGIRERVSNLGGKVIIESAPDKGTNINIRIPLGE